MAEPLIESEAMVGSWDGDAGGWSARDWVPGPAGTVGLTLPGGVELEVDVAAPNTFVGMWVDAADGRRGRPGRETIETVTALLGAERAFDLLGTTSARPRQLSRSVDRAVDELRRRRRPQQGTFDPTEPGLNPSLARHALAAAQSTELGVSDLAVALSLIDAAASARRMDGLDLERRAQEAARRGVEILLDAWPDVGDVDPRELGRALGRVRRLLPRPMGERARAIRDALEGRSRRRWRDDDLADGDLADDVHLIRRRAAAPLAASREMAPARLELRATPAARLLPVDVRGLAESYRVVSAAGRVTTPSEAEVRVPDRIDLADRLWARCFHRDGAMLAAAPMIAVDQDAVARLLVPPGALRKDCELDVTDRPGDPRPSRAVRSVLDAVGQGRDAARAERLGDVKESYARWGRSSASWSEAGDDDRSRQARQYAEDFDRAGRIPPTLLADPVVERGE